MIASILRYSSKSSSLSRKERIHADDEYNANIRTLKSKEYSPTIDGNVRILLAEAEGEAEDSQIFAYESEFYDDPSDLEAFQEDPDSFTRQILEAEQLKLHWPDYRTDSLKKSIRELDPAYEEILWNDTIPEVHFLVFFCQSNLNNLFKKYLYSYHNNLINLCAQWQTNFNLPQKASTFHS